MKFHKVEIENFGTMGSLVTLPLSDQGLVLVTGVNNDTAKSNSNGAGKSLLLDAFCWGIWGKTIREDKDDDVVNRHVGKNCLVKVYFEEKGKEYIVARYRKHKKAKKPNDLELYLGTANVSSTSMANTQDVINNLIGVNFNTFCAMMPGSGKNAAQMTDADIKELLENMLQTSTLARAREIARERKDKEVKPSLQEKAVELQGLLKEKEHASIRLEGFQTEFETFEEKKQEKLETLENQRKRTEASIAEETKRVEAVLVAQLEHTRIDSAILQWEQKLVESRGAQESLISYNLERRHTVQAQTQQCESSLEESKARLIRVAGLVGQCGLCTQAVEEEHKETLQKAEEDKIDRLCENIQLMQDSLVNLGEEETKAMGEFAREQAVFVAERDLLRDSQRILESIMKAGSDAAIKIEMLKKDLSRIIQEILTTEDEEAPYSHWIVDTKAEIVKLQRSIKSVSGKMAKLENELTMLEFWQSAFSASGIRSHILDNVTPILNESAKHYCDLLTDGEMGVTFSTKSTLKSGEVREKFSINIEQKHGGGTYRSNSKGERQRANLAVSFALGDLAELRSNKRIPFRFLDEPFENIDESGTEAVLALLIEQQQKYPTVFVVTHLGHFKELFPKEITVVKKNGISTLETK